MFLMVYTFLSFSVFAQTPDQPENDFEDFFNDFNRETLSVSEVRTQSPWGFHRDRESELLQKLSFLVKKSNPSTKLLPKLISQKVNINSFNIELKQVPVLTRYTDLLTLFEGHFEANETLRVILKTNLRDPKNYPEFKWLQNGATAEDVKFIAYFFEKIPITQKSPLYLPSAFQFKLQFQPEVDLFEVWLETYTIFRNKSVDVSSKEFISLLKDLGIDGFFTSKLIVSRTEQYFSALVNYMIDQNSHPLRMHPVDATRFRLVTEVLKKYNQISTSINENSLIQKIQISLNRFCAKFLN